MKEQRNPPQSQRNGVRESLGRRIWLNAKGLASTVVFVWLFTNHIAQATVVPTESMTPTILVGDHFFLDKVGFPSNYPQALRSFLPEREIHRGDIVAFWSPEEPDLRLVKRVVGLPGDRIEVRGGDVYINGRKQPEPYAVHTLPALAGLAGDTGPLALGQDTFFMMGDNRDNSRDSRYFGPVGRDRIIGRPLFVYWSFDGPYPLRGASISEWAEHYASVAAHFLTQTRWGRTGHVLR